MFRVLVFCAALALAVPGVISVASNATGAPAAPPPSVLAALPEDPDPTPTVVPTASPSPGDVTPPQTTAHGAGSGWRRTAATVRLEATDDASGVAATVYRLDEGDWTIGDRIEVEAPKSHANDGRHVITYYSVDNALNQETPQTVEVLIDTRPPKFAWTSVSPGLITSIRTVTCRFRIDEFTGPLRLSYEITDQYGYPAAGKGGLERDAGKRALQFVPRYKDGKGFAPGVYRVRITAKDEAGNETVSAWRPFRNYRPMTGGVWRHISGAGKRVALTFDDGGNAAWASILSTLKRYGAHATFFPLGSYAASSATLMRLTLEQGNAIGSHGWTHTQMTRQSTAQIQSEWMRAAAPWWSATGSSPVPYCRPPYGDYNGSVVAASGAAGFYRVILWDVDPRDWSQPGAGVIASRVLSAVHPGAIVVMHLTPQTAAALPAILSGLHARGYEACSLPEMFHAAHLR